MSSSFILTRTVNGVAATWQLQAGNNRLGRDPDSEVPLSDSSVSREHALLTIDSERAEISDLGSRNGSWLNGRALDQPTTLSPGDQIQLGDVILKFRDRTIPGERSPAGESATRLKWNDIKTGLDSPESATGNFWKAVMEAAQLMVLPQPMEKLFPTLLDLVESIAQADRILLLLRSEEKDTLDLVASRPQVDSSTELPLSRTLVDAVIQNRESILVEDVSSNAQFAAAESMADLNLNSAMAAPLFDNERVIGLIYAHTQGGSRQFDQSQLRALTMLANLIAIKLTNARLLQEYQGKLRLEQEMTAAGEVQQQILPGTLPEIPGYELEACLRPCLQMAGDFYDVRSLADGAVLLIVGDVSGKGSGAALLMSHLLAAFRVLAGGGLSVAALGQKLNEHLFESSDPTHFVTLWMAHLDPTTHLMTYMNAGHNPPLLHDRDGRWKSLDRTALPIGMLPEGEFLTEEITLEPGSVLCIYTDGLTEAQSGHEFYEEEGLRKSLSRHSTGSLDEIRDGVFADVQTYQQSESFEDDCTLMLLRRLD